jgi:uncharacterized membrane protein HdeD (DUF308 family)
MTTDVMKQSEDTGFPWWLVLIEGIALLILGIMFIAEPRMTTTIVVWLLGFYWLVVGILKIVSIFQDNAMWGWKLFAGILGIIAGILGRRLGCRYPGCHQHPDRYHLAGKYLALYLLPALGAWYPGDHRRHRRHHRGLQVEIRFERGN